MLLYASRQATLTVTTTSLQENSKHIDAHQACFAKKSLNPLVCLQYKVEHHFITYRGLMYEFGCYGTRVQDPLDPKYEYRNGGRTYFNCEKVASSATCTYEQIKKFSKDWTDYELCGHNCQDYARGLEKYINMNCMEQGGRRRDETSDVDFANFVFRLSGQNCTSGLNATANSSSSSTISLTMGMIIAIGIIAGLML